MHALLLSSTAWLKISSHAFALLPASQSFVVLATESIKRGQQVFLTYGKLANFLLLPQFGFVLMDLGSPPDIALIDCTSVIGRVKQSDGAALDEVCPRPLLRVPLLTSPLLPSPPLPSPPLRSPLLYLLCTTVFSRRPTVNACRSDLRAHSTTACTHCGASSRTRVC